ncbi:MAG: NAD(P)H-hydrate epimerase, partial [Candidatus Omnitrophota bacterium]
ALTLMEDAAAACARWLLRVCRGNNPNVVFFVGRGNNGADGMAVARHLYAVGCCVSVVCIDRRDTYSSEAEIQLAMIDNCAISISYFWRRADREAVERALRECDWVVDAIFGIGLKRPLSGDHLTAVRAVNACGKKVFAVDIPSGMNADTGSAMPEAVRADITVTFGLCKKGLALPSSRKIAGRLVVDPIGLPRLYWKRFGRRR